MDPLVRVSVQLQKLLARSFGVVLGGLLGVYLVAWALDPPPAFFSWIATLALGVSIVWQGVLLLQERSRELPVHADRGLFASLVVAVYAALLHLPGGLEGPYHALLYGLILGAATVARPWTLFFTISWTAGLEFALRTVAFGQDDVSVLIPRMGLLAVWGGLVAFLLRREVSRVRRLGKKHVDGELARLQEVARAYRLVGGSPAVEGAHRAEEQAMHSSVEEIRRAVRFSLEFVRDTIGARTAALLAVEGDKKLVVHDAVSQAVVSEARLSASEGIFSVVLARREPLVLLGARADAHSALYDGAPAAAALALVPLHDGERARGVLLVDRLEDRAFSTDEVRALQSAGAFILRAMENERVFSSLARQSREQSKLYRAAQALAALTSEAEVIEVGVESAREMAAFDFAAVTLFHKKTGSHEICAVSGEGSDSLVGRTFRHNAGLVSMVVASRHALPYRGEYEPSRQTVFARGHEPPPMPSLLVLPLIVHDRVLGTLVLGSTIRGAFDESVRPTLEVLASHMAVSLANARMLKRLEEQATTDGLTGLLNKRALLSEAERRIKIAERFKKPLSVLVTDIDHFKKVNDTYGHDVGDVVIKGMGEVLRRIKRDTDVVGRFGGEEFVIVCEQTDQEGARNLAERIRKELESTTFQTELGPLQVTCSVGVSTYPAAGADWDALFKATDEALYTSKRAGRNQVTVWTPRLRGSTAA